LGEQKIIDAAGESEKLREFMQRLLVDMRALETMIERGMIEEGVRRIGAEQEMFLVDKDGRPAPAITELLERIGDPHFVTEVARFNLEFNLDPLPFGGDCLSRLERQCDQFLARVREAGKEIGVSPLLVGILPTIRKSDLGLENMTPNPRYFALNRALTALRGKNYEISIKGVDELMVQHDSVMLEACNSSFQIHWQVGASEFARMYNIAQAITGPVLAAATNSPVLFGKRLWHETRIAVFQQAVDTRGSSTSMRERGPRVDFGRAWVKESILEIHREDVARHRVLLAADVDGDPFEALDRGEAPTLKALRLHNGTVYRWNRPCYGITEGKPHLRIEARVMPSGPTIVDEIANAALWYGLMNSFADRGFDVTHGMSFEDAKMNFLAAARHGIAAQMTWMKGETIPAQHLLRDKLIPLAREGLEAAKIDRGDIDRYLGVLDTRVRAGATGSRWILKSQQAIEAHGTPAERAAAITAAIGRRQATGESVVHWPLARLAEGGGWRSHYLRVEQFMTTDLTTVHPDEALDLVANLMVWERLRYVPVEDSENRLVGLVSYRHLLRFLAKGMLEGRTKPVAVREVMQDHVLTVEPDTPTLDAIRLMREQKIGCLPVVKEGHLVGVLMERDYMDIAAELLEQNLSSAAGAERQADE
jgi:CBS domain-containing protein/gamma-glutamyl:cysteine ligase YbdK (ATP-grasp superfamily)